MSSRLLPAVALLAYGTELDGGGGFGRRMRARAPFVHRKPVPVWQPRPLPIQILWSIIDSTPFSQPRIASVRPLARSPGLGPLFVRTSPHLLAAPQIKSSGVAVGFHSARCGDRPVNWPATIDLSRCCGGRSFRRLIHENTIRICLSRRLSCALNLRRLCRRLIIRCGDEKRKTRPPLIIISKLAGRGTGER